MVFLRCEFADVSQDSLIEQMLWDNNCTGMASRRCGLSCEQSGMICARNTCCRFDTVAYL